MARGARCSMPFPTPSTSRRRWKARKPRGCCTLLAAAAGAKVTVPRMLLTLHYLDEVPIGDIAVMTGLAEGTIKSHLFRSRKRLRELLQPRLVGVAA